MKKIGLALAFAAVIALSFAACSNSSDSGAAAAAAAAAAGSGTGSGTGGGTNTGTENGGGNTSGESAVPKGPFLRAEAVEGGIKFTIKALGAKYNTTDCFIFSKETEPCDIGRFNPEWSDRTKDWTGVYPYVSAGQKYKFGLIISGLTDETAEVTATGGSGQIPYDANTRSCFSVDDTGIDIFADKFPPTVIPTGVTNKRVFVDFNAGEWTTRSWNGTWVDCLVKGEQDFVQPVDASGNCVYHIASTDDLYTRLKNKMTGEHSGKRMFIEFTYRYKLAGFAAECQSRQLRSTPMSVDWAPLQNESANFKAEPDSNGIKLTIKAPADSSRYDDPNVNIHIVMQQNDGMEFGRIYPTWTDKSQAWTCVYPFVDNGKTYQIRFEPHGNLQTETFKCKAGGGLGEITYGANPYAINPRLCLNLSKSSIVVGAIDYPPSLIPASATDKKAYIAYQAGTGWNDATQFWDAQFILDRRETDLREPELSSSGYNWPGYSIYNTNPDYTTIQNAMKNTYPEKKIFAQFYFEFKVAGITGTCCTRHMNSEPVDASILRQ